jgi:CubicO group peptidase (beta-lactamase class C family)
MNTKRRNSLLLSIALTFVAAASARANDIDDFVKAVMAQRHIPAASIAVIKDGVVVKVAGYGLADMENNIAARPDTVYKIGSVSKQFIPRESCCFFRMERSRSTTR